MTPGNFQRARHLSQHQAGRAIPVRPFSRCLPTRNTRRRNDWSRPLHRQQTTPRKSARARSGTEKVQTFNYGVYKYIGRLTGTSYYWEIGTRATTCGPRSVLRLTKMQRIRLGPEPVLAAQCECIQAGSARVFLYGSVAPAIGVNIASSQ